MKEITVNPHLEHRKFTAERGALLFGAAFFLTILSPFGTDASLTTLYRFVYWFGVILGGGAIAITVSNPFRVRAASRRGMRRALVLSAQIAAVSIPITLLVAGMEMWLREPLSWVQLPQIFGYVVTITAVITVASAFIDQYGVLKEKIENDVTVNQNQSRSNKSLTMTRFHLRLDPSRRKSEILMLRAEDHYLHVLTNAGSEMIRCTLAMAIDELSAVDGQRTHRSCWVARSAVLETELRGGRRRLIMKDGTTAPLSRQRYRELSKSAWLPV